MSTQYLTIDQAPQAPAYDPKEMAQGLGWGVLVLLAPLLYEVNALLEKRLVRTLVQSVEAILTFRDRINGLVLSELGGYLDQMGSAKAWTKRLSRLLHAPQWAAALLERFLWQHADQRVPAWKHQGHHGLVLWNSSVWEKPESLKSEGLGPVPSSKAHRLTHIKPGYDTPPGRPICVPGLRLLQSLARRWYGRARAGSPGRHAALGPRGGCGEARVRDQECKLLREARPALGATGASRV